MDPNNKIIHDYPKELLELLFTVLPDNTNPQPYRIDEILKKMVDADSSLKKDARYLELKRRYAIWQLWNTRDRSDVFKASSG